MVNFAEGEWQSYKGDISHMIRGSRIKKIHAVSFIPEGPEMVIANPEADEGGTMEEPLNQK